MTKAESGMTKDFKVEETK